jgi:hypothetical protein
MWDYDWLGYGLTITAPCGKDIFLQGEEASDLYDRLEAMSPEEVQMELSEYDVLLED